MLPRVFRSSTDAYVFGGFIDQLFRHCGRWPEPKSVLVIDNVSFHHSEWDCADVCRYGIKLVYLPPFSSEWNPVKGYVARLKGCEDYV